jgi:hypothetical protein
MDQTIGIDFQPKNVQATIGEFAKIEGALTRLSGVAANVGKVFSSMKEGTSSMSSMTREFSTGITGMNRSISELGSTSKKVFGDMNKLMAGTGKAGGAGMLGGGKGAGGDFLGGGVVPWFMIRWKAYTEMLKAGHAMITDVMLGKKREPLMEQFAGLGYLGLDREQILKLENRGRKFRQDFPAAGIDPKEFLNMARESISGMAEYFKPETMAEKVGEITAVGAAMAKVTKTKPEEMERMLGQVVQARLMRMPRAQREAYENQEKDISDLYAETASQVSHVIQKSHMWGKHLTYLASQSLPSALARNVDFGDLAAMFGGLVSAGVGGRGGGTRAAVALRNMFETEGEHFAKLHIAAYGGMAKLSQMPGDAREFFLHKRGEQLMQGAGQDLLGFIQRVGEWAKMAKGRGLELNMMGFPVSFSSALNTFLTEGYLDKVKQIMLEQPQIKTLPELAEAMKTKFGVGEQETAWRRLSSAWDDMMNAWTLAANKSGETSTVANSMVTALDTTTGYFKGTKSSLDAMMASADAISTTFSYIGGIILKVDEKLKIGANELGQRFGEKYLPEWMRFKKDEQPINLDKYPETMSSATGQWWDIITKKYPEAVSTAGGILLEGTKDTGRFAAQDITGAAGGAVDYTGEVFAPLFDIIKRLTEKTEPEGEKAPIRIENITQLDGREIARSVNEINAESNRAAGTVFGSGWGMSPHAP